MFCSFFGCLYGGFWQCGAGVAIGVTVGRAGDLAIQSFDGTGKLTFNEVSMAEMYRVQWVPSPAGPWTNTWEGLAAIAANGYGHYAMAGDVREWCWDASGSSRILRGGQEAVTIER